MKRTTVFLADDTIKKLQVVCEKRQIKTAEAIRLALDWYLSLTDYSQGAVAQIQVIHPEKTPAEVINWAIFKVIEDRRERKQNNENFESLVLAELLHIRSALQKLADSAPSTPIIDHRSSDNSGV